MQDVYKRQGKALTDTAPRKEEKLYLVNGTPNYYFGMEVSANFVQQKNGPVSYTHLDVYKRQIVTLSATINAE